LADYEPRRSTLAARHAAYSANLVWLVVALSPEAVDVAELVGAPGDVRAEDGSDVSVYRSLPWPLESVAQSIVDPPGSVFSDIRLSSDSSAGRAVRRGAFLQTSHGLRDWLHVLIPYWRAVDENMRHVSGLRPEPGGPSAVASPRLLLELLLHPVGSHAAAHRVELYASAFRIVPAESSRFTELLFRQLREDAAVLPVQAVADLLFHHRGAHAADPEGVLAVVAALGARVGPDDHLLLDLFGNDPAAGDRFTAEVRKAFARLRLPSPLGPPS
jgi:hypothetical protein